MTLVTPALAPGYEAEVISRENGEVVDLTGDLVVDVTLCIRILPTSPVKSITSPFPQNTTSSSELEFSFEATRVNSWYASKCAFDLPPPVPY